MKNKKITSLALVLLMFFSLFLSACGNNLLIEKTAKNLSNYNIDMVYNTTENTATVKQEVEYKNNSKSILNMVKFQLYANAFSQGAVNKPVSSLYEERAYPNGKSYGGIEITSLKVAGKVQETLIEGIDDTVLVVNLQEQLKPKKKVKIEMEYTLTLPNINHRFGYGNNAINLGNFYPIACVYEKDKFVTNPYSSNGDPFYSDLANYLVKTTYANDHTLASTGEQTNLEYISNENKKSTIKAKVVRDFAMVLSNKFETLTVKENGTEINYYYHSDSKPQESLATAQKALKTFNKMIGEYPYSTLSIVETNFVHGGMEYPNLVYISDALDNYADYTNVIVHEIAHQWWYGMVGSNAYENGWLDEGLTEYTTALFYEKNPEYDVKLADIMANAQTAYTMFTDVYENVFGKVNTSLARALNEYNTEPEYVYMAYVKAMLLFDNIREVVGNKRFFKALKTYFDDNKMANVTKNHLIKAFEEGSGRKLKSVFNSWIDGNVLIKEINWFFN